MAETEAEFQEAVVDLAHMLGWEHLHVRRHRDGDARASGRATGRSSPSPTGGPSRSSFLVRELKVGPTPTCGPRPTGTASRASSAPHPRARLDVGALVIGRAGQRSVSFECDVTGIPARIGRLEELRYPWSAVSVVHLEDLPRLLLGARHVDRWPDQEPGR